MFRPLPLWNNIPCPAIKSGSACSLPHCLFSHEIVAAPAIIPSPPSQALPNITQSPANKDPSPSPTPRPLATAPAPAPTPTPAQPTVSPAVARDPRILVSANNVASPSTHRKRRLVTGDEDSYTSSSSDGGVPLNADPAPPPVKRTKTNVEHAGSAATTAAPRPKSILKTHAKVNAQTSLPTSKSQKIVKASPKPRPQPKAHTEEITKNLPLPQKAGEASTKTIPPSLATGSTASRASKAATAKSSASDKPLSLNPRLVAMAPASHDIRLKLLTLLHKEYVRLHEYKGDEQLMLRYALDEEEISATQKKSIYIHVMKTRIIKLSKTTPEEYRKAVEEEKAEQLRKSGDPNMTPALSTGKTIQEELDALRPLINSPKMLQTYGYNLDPPTEKEIKLSLDGLKSAGGWEQCDRCTTRFQVYQGRRESDGELASGGKCIFHWGRLTFLQPYQDNARDRVYSCCRRVAGDPGCTTAENHVFKVNEAKRLAASWPFIRTTLPPTPVGKAICLDCEMCYTACGMELIRITATAFPTGAIVMDALVRPFGEILDLNTRFSGVHPQEFISAQPFTPQPYPTSTTLLDPCSSAPASSTSPLGIISSPSAARDILLTYMDSETPLIGHALENDLNALRLCHSNIVDTAILYPHMRGIPARNKLKYLVDKHLGRKIQVEGAPDGHDSAIDARCAGELVRHKICGECRCSNQ
ncbi:hypothetical protein L873DRAFT_1703663 [Choiromyces venosus 120613-1]|uniref:Exonuclease domain-containing protein n=1 Tax=Choiromyces venosus 120613-1 TaxID=1336337 RepID=A0A3N4JAT9_9PEZI|nr:hypothetical protein L873DRAFT_1703663 [Choiromyces venosus 120613-1]